MHSSVFSLFSCVFYLLSISSAKRNIEPPTPCDSLVPDYCTFPWPNDYWLLKDANGNPNHLVLSDENLPKSVDGKTINPTSWNLLDGFSPIPAIMTFWKDINIDNTARLWNISASNDIDSPIIILNAKHMTRISHWVELDHSSDTPNIPPYNQQNRSLMVWPSERLNDSELYIVAMRNLYDNNDQLLSPSPGFKALRDNIPTNDSSIESRRDYYNNFVFPTLQSNGIERSTLQIAWYFTTMSEPFHVQRMVTMRDDAFGRIVNNEIDYRIEFVEQKPWNNVARKVKGFFKVPWYLNSRLPGMNVRIVTAPDSPLTPIYQKDEDVEFELLIPNSAANESKVARYVQYGHGLFGSMQEIEFGIFRQTANEYGYLLGAVNWLGLSWEDVVFVTEMIALNFTNFPMVPDRCHQGMLNALFFMKLLLSPKFKNDANIFVFDNVNIVSGNDPMYRHYYGNSQGGILGSVYMALSADVDRGVLGEPGSPYSLLLPRSVDFSTLFDVCKVRYRNDFDRIFLFETIQLLWNSLEPSGYIGHINKLKNNQLLPSTPVHHILIHYSLGDAQVTWLGAQIIARTLDCHMYRSQMAEYNETLYGYQWIDDDDYVIDVTQSPYSENGVCLIQGWNYDVPQVPFVNLPPDSQYDTHDDTSHQSDAQLGNYKFFADGVLYNPCNETCNGQR